MLEGEVVIETPDYCAVKVGALFLGTSRVEGYQPPTWPSAEGSQQIHPDVAVENLDAAERTAIELGATKEHHQPSPAQHNPASYATRPGTPSACAPDLAQRRGALDLSGS
ncbi:VOC family protein [Nocardioides insulae]|uniref:VOC family protein n=1 Tax=Nocardioides insulae TaxID=394734 RepID=UPI0012FAFB9D|nr:VOC family protein [Nocardioides insulae]